MLRASLFCLGCSFVAAQIYESPFDGTYAGTIGDWDVRFEMEPCELDWEDIYEDPPFCAETVYQNRVSNEVSVDRAVFTGDFICGPNFHPPGSGFLTTRCYNFMQGTETDPTCPFGRPDESAFLTLTMVRNDEETLFYNWVQGALTVFQMELKRNTTTGVAVTTSTQGAATDTKVDDLCSGYDNHPYVGANYSEPGFDESFNGVWEGMATNYMPIDDPAVYPIRLTLDVSPNCGRDCGRIEYPNSNLAAPIAYAMPIECVMVLPPPPVQMPPLDMSSGRCFQFVEDFANEDAVGYPGGSQYVAAPFSVILQADGTIQWCYMQLTSCVGTSNLNRV